MPEWFWSEFRSERRARPAVRVFVAHPNELVRRGIRRILADTSDLRVIGDAETQDAAARRVARLHPDVLVTDVTLAEGTGVELCLRARATDSDVRILVLTSSTDPDVVHAAVLAGCDAYLLDRLRAGQLTEAVRLVAAGQSLLDPVVTGTVLHRLRAPEAAASDSRIAGLTVRERRILDLMVEGRTNREIGAVLQLSEQTVKNQVTGLLAKLGVRRRTQAVALGTRLRRGRTQRHNGSPA